MVPEYDKDFYGWAMGTAELIRERRFHDLDFENLIEEIESMGRSERHQLTNRLSLLIAHLLKWQLQPDFRGRSWHGTIKEQRLRIQEVLEDSPSLKSRREESMNRAYGLACSLVEKETPIDLKLLPKVCPYTFEQCIDDEFYP